MKIFGAHWFRLKYKRDEAHTKHICVRFILVNVYTKHICARIILVNLN